MNKLPKTAPKHSLHAKHYANKVPGHHIQADVKLLWLKNSAGKAVKRFQYTTIDDATRIRALQIIPKHDQNSVIKFIEYVVDKNNFRIHTIKTDRGHEFQARFHWYVKDVGIRHADIKPHTNNSMVRLIGRFG